MPSLDGVSVFAQCQKAIDITLISLLTDIIHCVALTTQIGLQGLISPQMNWLEQVAYIGRRLKDTVRK